LLEHGHEGIKDNGKLHRCYDGILQDIEIMIEQGWIRVVEVTDGKKKSAKDAIKKRIFFPCDISNKKVEYTKDDLPSSCH